MQREKQWYIVYTQTGKELKALYSLNKKHIECFCPVNTSTLKAARNKTLESPILPNYIFVYIHPEECAVVRKIDGIKNFMYWLDKPVVMDDEDVYALKDLTTKYRVLKADHIKVNPTLQTTTSWKMAPVTAEDGFDEEEVITVSFPAYGFAITAKESKVNVRVINVNATNSKYRRRPSLFKI